MRDDIERGRVSIEGRGRCERTSCNGCKPRFSWRRRRTSSWQRASWRRLLSSREDVVSGRARRRGRRRRLVQSKPTCRRGRRSDATRRGPSPVASSAGLPSCHPPLQRVSLDSPLAGRPARCPANTWADDGRPQALPSRPRLCVRSLDASGRAADLRLRRLGPASMLKRPEDDAPDLGAMLGGWMG